ncbi:MAG: SDR family oxidoreductase [Prochloraceae cyanobacterium]|nr:SDR family oxidoreductase [Prochloraceae cyanobacterium]
MNLVVGATGFLGSEICRRLKARQLPVRGIIRPTSSPNTIANLKSLGVELVSGDLRDKESLEQACRGVNTVISTATTTRSRQPSDSIETTDLQGQLNLVEAARSAGVKHFIYISYSGGIGFDDPLTVAKRTVETNVRSSGMTYTILRPSYFMEVWLSPALGFDFPNAKATLYGAGTQKISWISLGDVAELAVQSLENSAATDAVLELGGPDALSPLEVINIFEKISKRSYDVELISVEELEAELASAKNSLTKAFAALKLFYGKGNIIPMDKTLEKFSLSLISVRDYANRVLLRM